jgi:hypothetical protein
MEEFDTLLRPSGIENDIGTTKNPDPPEKGKMKENKISRVTVRLTGDMGKAIDDIADVTGASSPSEVVRRAITIYHTLVKQKLAGNEAVIVVKDGDTEKSVPVFL